MHNGAINEQENATARQLRPVVVAVIAAKLAVSVLLLATVHYSPPAPLPEVAAIR